MKYNYFMNENQLLKRIKVIASKPFITLLIVLFTVQFQNSNAQNITIDLSKEHQIIRGFGGIHINAWTGQDFNADLREKAFDNDPGEIGLSIFRMQINPNKSAWLNELPIAQYAISKGAIVFASPWNQPSEMTSVLSQTSEYTDYVLRPEYYADYAEYLNSYINYMKNNGVPLYAISIQNEPDWHDWTRWTPTQMLTFVKQNAQNINCRVIAPETLGYLRNMCDPLLKDSVANSHFEILGTHIYGTTKANYYYPLAYEKKKEIWMTEHLLGSESQVLNTWSLAMDVADEINTCMDANMSAYVYWYIRRFFGLIDDMGNITDKGYVMSQFSKFIRPGSSRVDAGITSATNITATAYKTDSSIVIVVLNRHNSPVNIGFTIKNNILGVDSLTKFTTSQIKKVVNDGTFKLNNGIFSANVDAKSITTFTSDASRGGKFGNLPPVAFAGNDLELIDAVGTNLNITLKGSGSTDADGKIVKYSWVKDGYQISTSPDINVQVSTGNCSYILTVTDNDGVTDSDTINIKVVYQSTTDLWLEAECTRVSTNWHIINDTSSSNGKYLSIDTTLEALSAPYYREPDYLIYKFSLTEKGNYKVWGRVFAPTVNNNSFWIKMDNGQWIPWNGIVGGNTFQWDDVHNQTNSNPVVFLLNPGNHTLTVCYRENSTGIDKFYISNTGQTPTGIGANASNCGLSTNIKDFSNEENEVSVFPNPVKSALQIKSTKPFDNLVIFSINGSEVLRKIYPVAIHSDEIQINMENGIYIMRTNSNNFSSVVKFVVNK